MKRIGVQVNCDCFPDGAVLPRSILWPDGRVWKIDKVLYTCVPVDDGAPAIRYTVLIGNAERYLYRTGIEWSVSA